MLFESGIGSIIAQFVDYEYYEFLFCLNQFFGRVAFLKSEVSRIWLSAVDSYDEKELELEARRFAFIEVNFYSDANVAIAKYFSIFKSMSCGSDPMEFVGLFEHRLMGPVAFRLGVLEKAMMDGSNPLMMFEFDHNYTDMQEKVAFIFSHIVHKYFENNEQIMEIVLLQLMNCCIHYMSIKEPDIADDAISAKQAFIRQLMHHIKEECVKKPNTKYLPSLMKIKQLQSQMLHLQNDIQEPP
eukprot:829992_1